MMSKVLIGFKVFLNFLSSHIKSDDIPPVKLDILITYKRAKPIKMLKCEYRLCLNCLAAWFFKWKKWGRITRPACKVNTLKAEISLPFDM